MPSGGGGGTTTAGIPHGASVYTPQGQPTADAAYQGIVGDILGQLGGGTTPGQVYQPQINAATNSIYNNPYNQSAIDAAALARSTGIPFGQSLAGTGGELIADAGRATPYLGQALAQGFNPAYGSIVSQLEQNPYLQNALNGAWFGMNAGQSAAGMGAAGDTTLSTLANQFPSLGGYYAGQISGAGSQIPDAQRWLGSAAGALPGLAGGATSGSPLTALAQQDVFGLGGQAGGLAAGAASLAPVASGYGGYTAGLAPTAQYYGAAAAAPAGTLQGVSSALINSGFDPQSALYNRTRQQVLDQSNAVNAMSGVASTPYGAGVTDKALSDFNINWQNNLLNRQTQGAQAAQGLDQAAAGLYGTGLSGLGQAGSLAGTGANILGQAGGLYGQGANILGQAGNLYGGAGALGSALAGQYGTGANITQGLGSLAGAAGGLASTQGGLDTAALGAQTSGANTAANLLAGGLNLGRESAGLAASSAAAPSNVYTNNLQQILSGLNAQNNAGLIGANTFGGLLGSIGSGASTAGNLGSAGTNLIQQSGVAPYNVANTIAGNQLAGLGQGIQLGNQAYALPQQVLNDLQSYLGLGQSSSQIANQAGNLQLQQLLAAGQGIGGAANLLFGNSLGQSGGLLGAAGLNPFTSASLTNNALGGFGYVGMNADTLIGTQTGAIADAFGFGGTGLDSAISSFLPALLW